jgi:hypothetical protein
MPITIDDLSPTFLCIQVTGWLAICTRDPQCRKHFGTDRLAKLLPTDELQFTIGATEQGMSARLNCFIEGKISNAEFTVIDGASTAGNRSARYPAFDTGDERATADVVRRILHSVEDEAMRIAERPADKPTGA